MFAPPVDSTVGREAELATVAGFLDAVATGPAALLIEGAAGIGKTTLWRAAIAAAAARDVRAIVATALDLESDLPFVTLRDLLEPTPSDAAALLPAAQRHALDVALLRVSDPGRPADQHAVSVAVLGVVRALCDERPLVIAVDDVGWLDRSSERVLRYVVRRLTAERVGLLVAQRTASADVPLGLGGPPLREGLRRLELGPLDAEQMYALLTEQAGLALPRRVCRVIHRTAEGNPFYGLELGRAVQRAGRQVLYEGTVPLPGGVPRVTTRRVAALNPQVRHALAVVAALGSPTVASVTAALGEPAVDALAAAVDEGLLTVTGGAVGFQHPLLRAAAAATLTSGARRELHRHLAGIVPDPDERARHLSAATEIPDEPTAAVLDDAAARAFARGAPDAAAALATRAVALTPAGSVAAGRRQVNVGQYRYRAEDIGGAAAVLDDAVGSLPAGELRAEARLWLFFVRQAQNAMVDAGEVARLALTDEPGPALRAALERALAYAYVIGGDPATADAHAAAAVRVADRSADPVSAAESRTTLAWTQFWTGRGLRVDLLAGTRNRTEWTRYTPHGASPNALVAMMSSWADEIGAARAALSDEERRLSELGHDRPRVLVLFALAELECRTGSWGAALRHAEEGLRVAELAVADLYGALVRYARGLHHALHGRLDEARADAHAVIEAGRAGDAVVAVRFGASLLGFVALSVGDHEAVHRHLGPFAAGLPADGAYDPGLARFLPDEIEALVRLGRREDAERLLAPLEARAAILDRPWALGAAGRCRALLLAAAGDAAGAVDAVDAALIAHDRVALPFERARTLLVAGAVRRRARQRQEARAALTEALAEFTGLGAETWADRARGELDRLGTRAASPRALTESERRIAELVAAGRSNAEVAAEMFLTVNTVEAALWKIYRKLDVPSRSALAAHVARHDGGRR